jgi:hypothetical protein
MTSKLLALGPSGISGQPTFQLLRCDDDGHLRVAQPWRIVDIDWGRASPAKHDMPPIDMRGFRTAKLVFATQGKCKIHITAANRATDSFIEIACMTLEAHASDLLEVGGHAFLSAYCEPPQKLSGSVYMI